jgi:Na+/H+ antiporter
VLAVVLVVVLGGSVLAGDILGQRLRVPPPLVLLLIGVGLGFVPSLREVHLPPEVMLLLILPALLYWDSLTTSVREARANLRGILLLGTALVVVTAAAVASVAHAIGLSWAPAWVLGAALAPTDATAVAALARALPRRLVTTLRVESLINDGTALVVYGAAVAVTVSGTHFGPGSLALRFLLSYAGGVAAGFALHWAMRRVRRHMNDLLHENVLGVLAPFAAFLLAQGAHSSGVIAVVAYGLLLSREAPRSVRADTRQRGEAFWSLMTFALNGALFILIGIEANDAVRALSSVDLARGLAAALAIYASVIAARLGWLFTAPYLLRALDRRPQQRARRLSSRPRVVLALANFRGAVSLAAVLAVPRTLDSGRPFPGRDLLVFIVAMVITLTLAQALLLPRVVRWAQLPADTSTTLELGLAQQTAIKEALTALPDVARALEVSCEAVTRARQELEAQLNRADRPAQGNTPEPRDEYATLRLALIGRERAAVVRLRAEEQIDDDVLRLMQADLDFEELRLSRRRP